MLRTSLLFLIVAFVAVGAADISVTTQEPWIELKKIGAGFLSPDLFSLPEFSSAIFNTVSFSLLGITIAILLGTILSLFFEKTWIRLFCAFIRSIHEIFWAFIFMPLTGLNSLCGILAIAIPYAGIFAKVYAEIRQEADQRQSQALPSTTSSLSGFFYTTLPQIYGLMKNYTSYRLECALRSSAILGFIGLPTLGYHLETAFREGMYSEAASLLYCFYLLIASLRLWARAKIVLIPLILSIIYTTWEVSFSLHNITRFFTYDILPWPMRAEGYYAGTQSLSLPFSEIINWMITIFSSEALPGIWNTLVLSQIAMVATAIFALSTFAFASKIFFTQKITIPAHFLLIIIRTTPEYMIAYLLLQLWGPSMLPAIFALFLHNGAILAFLTARNVNQLNLSFDVSQKKTNLYLFEVLPRSYGHFLALLFYRWEIIIRESAILGILGITTLGHFIDSAITRDHLDTALFLIIITAMLNMLIDTLSQIIRRRLHISSHTVAETVAS